jgi:hypothetical protein
MNMHHDIRYNDPDDMVNEQAAMADIIWYLGSKYNSIANALQEEGDHGLDMLRLQLSFVGIQGYPVGVWYRRLYQ